MSAPIRIRKLAGLAGQRVILGMSGGVDSSVSAVLLQQQGAHVEGVFMRNWDTAEEGGPCPGDRDWRDVQAVCRHLNIPCRQIDFVREYWHRVFARTLEDYARGVTPNPDIACNREIKFGALMDRCVAPGTWLATGHYARIGCDANGRPHLLSGVDRSKDQSYYLSQLSQPQLERALFPLGELTKQQVRQLAHEHGLSTAAKEESMGICFVGERRRFTEFLAGYIPQHPGPVTTLEGTTIGEHQGIFSWTIGQRATICYGNEKWFVASKDIANNRIIVVPSTHHPALFSTQVHLVDWHWIAPEYARPVTDRLLQAKIRYQQRAESCRIEIGEHHRGVAHFVHPQRAPAPGQYLVAYDGDQCLGSGVIADTVSKTNSTKLTIN